MSTLVTGDDATFPIQLKKNNLPFAIDSGATVKVAIVSQDHKSIIAAAVTCSNAAAGADWANSLIVAVIPSATTAAITVTGPALLEIQVDDGGKLTWFVDINIVQGHIA